MSESRRGAGWYDDEQDAAVLRYWDGTSWTPHTTVRPDADADPAPAASNVSLGVTSMPGAGVRGTGARGRPAGGTSARGAVASVPAAASVTPAPVDTLVDGFSISEMTSMRTATIPSMTPVSAGTAPVTTGPPAYAPAPAADPRSAAAPAAAFTPPPAFAGAPPAPGAPGAPDEHTTAPLRPGAPRAVGAGVDEDTVYAPAGRSFVLIWLFALFLGSLGIDRFALGKTGTAVAKLVTAGGFGVWTLVDLVLVLTGAQRDREGHPLTGYATHRRLAWIVSGVVVALGVLAGVGVGIAAAELAAALGRVGRLP